MSTESSERPEESKPSESADTTRSTLAAANRESMPKVTAAVDAFKAVFGELRVTYAQENGITKGKRREQ
jgi:hypothetical protein